MMKRLLTLAAVFAFSVPAIALACGDKKEVHQVTINEGKSLLDAKKAVFVDANGSSTRAKMGVIPGAVLLTDSSEFDVAKELPASKDKQLVFYCANTRCGASTEAAKRAMDAGYMNVAVLPEGIMGWVKAGMPTQKEKHAAATTSAGS